MNEITIKLSNDSDRDRIATLAQLDGGRPPAGDVLLAEIDGRLVAAVGMDGTAVSDPFERTAALVETLRGQVRDVPRRRPARRRRLGPLGRLLPA
jgi:hypothetical protein